MWLRSSTYPPPPPTHTPPDPSTCTMCHWVRLYLFYTFRSPPFFGPRKKQSLQDSNSIHSEWQNVFFFVFFSRFSTISLFEAEYEMFWILSHKFRPQYIVLHGTILEDFKNASLWLNPYFLFNWSTQSYKSDQSWILPEKSSVIKWISDFEIIIDLWQG